jgi:hypothetical protein
MKKNIYRKIGLIIFGSIAFTSCEDPEYGKPNTDTDAQDLMANFLFVNASPDAPSLDFFVNNEKIGASLLASENHSGYQSVIISGNNIATTNIRARGSSGAVGGVLNTSDIIYRSGSNNANNFAALAGANYTIFAIDSINRPKPVRTLNSGNFGDITYYSSRDAFTAPAIASAGDTTIALSVGSNNSITTINLVRKYNGGNLPSFIVPIGTVPLGSTDPGGVRFYVTQDIFPTFSGTNATQSAIRFINLSPNSPGLYVRLLGSPNVTIATNAPFIVSNSVFNPTVGSRTSTTSFTLQNTAVASTANTYTVQVSTTAGFTNIIATIPNVEFQINKVYTIYASGLVGGTGSEAFTAKIITHN